MRNKQYTPVTSLAAKAEFYRSISHIKALAGLIYLPLKFIFSNDGRNRTLIGNLFQLIGALIALTLFSPVIAITAAVICVGLVVSLSTMLLSGIVRSLGIFWKPSLSSHEDGLATRLKSQRFRLLWLFVPLAAVGLGIYDVTHTATLPITADVGMLLLGMAMFSYAVLRVLGGWKIQEYSNESTSITMDNPLFLALPGLYVLLASWRRVLTIVLPALVIAAGIMVVSMVPSIQAALISNPLLGMSAMAASMGIFMVLSFAINGTIEKGKNPCENKGILLNLPRSSAHFSPQYSHRNTRSRTGSSNHPGKPTPRQRAK